MAAYEREDYAEAARLYRLAADRDHPGAAFVLATMYENGQGVVQSRSEAIDWYTNAAIGGNEEANLALRRLGENEYRREDDTVVMTKTIHVAEAIAAYERGDYTEAVRLLLLDADHVDVAMLRLGAMYVNGKGCSGTTPRPSVSSAAPLNWGTPMRSSTSA